MSDNGSMKDQEDTKVSQDDDDEKSILLTFVAESEERLNTKKTQRESNLIENIKYPEESFFVRLDSSIKKNSAFVKKLRNMTEAQKDSILKDMNGLNLTKYISEVASAIVDAKLKMSEVNMALKICCMLHQRYPDFCANLLEAWQKYLPKKPGETISASKMRIDIRFIGELISSGIFAPKEGLPLLGNLLMILTVNDKETHNNLNILLSFCRHCGDDYAGFLPRKMRLLSEKYDIVIPRSDFLPPDRQKGLKNLLKDYYKTLCVHAVKEHKLLQNQDRQNRRTLQTKGELPKDRKEKFEAKQIEWQKLWSATQQMADILDEDLPELPPDLPEFMDEPEDIGGSLNFDVTNRFKGQPEFDAGALWEDEDTRSFYEHLPELKSQIPQILYKDCLKEEAKSLESKETKDDKIEKSEKDENMESEANDQAPTDVTENAEDEETTDVVEETDDDVNPALVDADLEADESDEDSNRESALKQSNKVLLDAFLSSLPNCVNRDMIDKSAVNFCTNLNTKHNRKKLVRALFTVQRTRLDLLPFYARFVAQLSPIMPRVASDLVSLLKQDFRFLVRKKDQINIESKVKNVRFIGELVKFTIFPKSEALHCLKLLLNDFTHHHIEMTCNLLETCGRYLYRSNDSHHRAKILLDQMLRKKALLPFDSRYITMIENAYYFANPPESQMIPKVERPPMYQYIRKLLFFDLLKTNVDKVLRQIRKLNWDDHETASYAIKCLISVWNAKFYNVRCVANLLAGLNAFQDWIAPQVIDGVIEDIRLGMEINHPKYNQRRVSIMRYLGELYNYRLVESSVVFKILYSLITFGVYYDRDVYSELDPPDNLIRIRLVCQLLETCGQYFSSGLTKKKLDCYLVFFQRYFWFKKVNFDEITWPFSMDLLFKDVLQLLRPKFKFVICYEEANRAVETLLNELKPKVVELVPSLNTETKTHVSDNAQENLGLCSITEAEEEDEDQENDSESIANEASHQESEYDSNEEAIQKTTDEETETDAAHETSEPEPRQKGLKTYKCAEDDDFLKDFDKMMSESLVSRTQEVVRSNTDIVVPMTRNASAKKSVAFFDSSTIDTSEVSPTINFMIMTKTKGNKPVLKSVDVPVNSDLVQSLKDSKEAERAEKEAVKKLTLNINERREMEDRDAEFEKSGTSPVVVNLNRDYRRKYQHPKGVPDADLIFGNKKR